jgi:hypothetical protein
MIEEFGSPSGYHFQWTNLQSVNRSIFQSSILYPPSSIFPLFPSLHYQTGAKKVGLLDTFLNAVLVSVT